MVTVDNSARNAAVVRSFVRWMRMERYADSTVKCYPLYVRRALRWCDAEGLSLKRARLEDLERWWSTLPVGASSRSQGRKALVLFYQSTGRAPNPAELLPQIKSTRGRSRHLSPFGLAAFLTAAHALGGIHEVIGMTFATTGVRFAELQRARWHQFDLAGEARWLVEGKGSNRRGPKTRVVHLHPELVPVLRKYRADSGTFDYLFPNRAPSSRPYFSEAAMRRHFNEILEEAGLPIGAKVPQGVVPHRLRHTVGTEARKIVGDPYVIAEILGHDNVATTQIYCGVDEAEVRAVVAALPA